MLYYKDKQTTVKVKHLLSSDRYEEKIVDAQETAHILP